VLVNSFLHCIYLRAHPCSSFTTSLQASYVDCTERRTRANTTDWDAASDRLNAEIRSCVVVLYTVAYSASLQISIFGGRIFIRRCVLRNLANFVPGVVQLAPPRNDR